MIAMMLAMGFSIILGLIGLVIWQSLKAIKDNPRKAIETAFTINRMLRR